MLALGAPGGSGCWCPSSLAPGESAENFESIIFSEVDGEMPELVRSLARRLRELVGNRRYAHRFHARVSCSIALPMMRNSVESSVAAAPQTQLPKIDGYTRDLSATGLSIVVSSIRIGERYLTADGHHLRITLKHSSGAIEFQATPMRYEQVEKTADETGYLIGVQINSISDHDRQSYLELLRTIHQRRRE